MINSDSYTMTTITLNYPYTPNKTHEDTHS